MWKFAPTLPGIPVLIDDPCILQKYPDITQKYGSFAGCRTGKQNANYMLGINTATSSNRHGPAKTFGPKTAFGKTSLLPLV